MLFWQEMQSVLKKGGERQVALHFNNSNIYKK